MKKQIIELRILLGFFISLPWFTLAYVIYTHLLDQTSLVELFEIIISDTNLIQNGFLESAIILIPFIGSFYLQKLKPLSLYFMVLICSAILCTHIVVALNFFTQLPEDMQFLSNIRLYWIVSWLYISFLYLRIVKQLTKESSKVI